MLYCTKLKCFNAFKWDSKSNHAIFSINLLSVKLVNCSFGLTDQGAQFQLCSQQKTKRKSELNHLLLHIRHLLRWDVNLLSAGLTVRRIRYFMCCSFPKLVNISACRGSSRCSICFCLPISVAVPTVTCFYCCIHLFICDKYSVDHMWLCV